MSAFQPKKEMPIAMKDLSRTMTRKSVLISRVSPHGTAQKVEMMQAESRKEWPLRRRSWPTTGKREWWQSLTEVKSEAEALIDHLDE
jgi:hypothetical protein